MRVALAMSSSARSTKPFSLAQIGKFRIAKDAAHGDSTGSAGTRNDPKANSYASFSLLAVMHFKRSVGSYGVYCMPSVAKSRTKRREPPAYTVLMCSDGTGPLRFALEIGTASIAVEGIWSVDLTFLVAVLPSTLRVLARI